MLTNLGIAPASVSRLGTPTHGAATSGTGSTVTAPTGLVDGDLIIVTQSQQGTGAPPAGWTQLFNDTSTSAINFAAWWKVASSEPASWSFTGSGSIGWACGYWTGVSTSSPIDASASPTNTNSSPTVATTVNGCAIVQLAAIDETAGGFTFTIDPSCTSLVQETTGPELAVSYDTSNQASAGTTTARAITNTSPRNTLIATVALAPGSGSGLRGGASQPSRERSGHAPPAGRAHARRGGSC